jgi:hypothetical protein
MRWCPCYEGQSDEDWGCQGPSHRDESGYGKGVGVYDTLIQSDTEQTYGRVKSDTRPVGVDSTSTVKLRKKPKDLSVSDREECYCEKKQRTWVEWEGGVWVWGGCEYGECKWKCFMYDVWCGLFTKVYPSSLTVNRLHDPTGMTSHPSTRINSGVLLIRKIPLVNTGDHIRPLWRWGTM